MIPTDSRRRGFTLVELLCVMMLLTVLLMIVSILFVETMRVEQIQSANFNYLLLSKALADQFREDVAQAEGEETEWNQFQSDDATLILRLKNKEHVLYRWADGQLMRQVFAGDESLKKRTLPVGRESVAVEFIHAGKERVVRMRLYPLRNSKREAGNALELAAPLGGNWR